MNRQPCDDDGYVSDTRVAPETDWRAGDPCGSCGSRSTVDAPGDGAHCLSCGASDIESEAWVDLRA